MRLLERLRRFDPRRKLRFELQKVRSRANVLSAERDAHLLESGRSTGERNEYLRQRDIALGERSEFLRQRDVAFGERSEFLRQRDVALGERNEYLRQRDIALGERNEFLRQRDVVIGLNNLQVDWSARHAHRADMVARPAAGTPERLLLFLHLAKTGGVTLADILARNLATEEFLRIDMAETDASAIGTWSHRTVELTLGRLQKPQVDQLRAVWGHYRQGIQDHLPKPCAVVTLLREPVDRVISVYHYWSDLAGWNTGTLEDYFTRQSYGVGFDNYMTRVFSGNPALDPIAVTGRDATTANSPRPTEADFEAAARNLDGYLVVGTTDQFDQTLLVLGSDLCWSLSDLVYRPLNGTASRPAHSDISDELREKILSWNRYDAILTEQARAHLARRVAAYRGDFDRDLALFRELNSLFQRGAPAEELRRTERGARSSAPAQRQ